MKKLIVFLLFIGVIYWWWLPHTVQGPLSDHEFEYIIRTSGDCSSSDTLPMIIALHGNGDTTDNFFKTLFDNFDYPARFVVVRGPVDYAWFSLGSRAWPMESGGLREYGDALADAVPVLLERFPTEGKPIVVGFSGGAFFAYYLAACHSDMFSYIFPLSGGLPNTLSCKSAYVGARVIAFHGNKDQVVEFNMGMDAVQYLRQRGLNAELITFDGGHIDIFRSANRVLLHKLRDVLNGMSS
jgi:predicted esterase